VKAKGIRDRIILFLFTIFIMYFIAEALAGYFEQLPSYDPNVVFAVDAGQTHIHQESRIPGLIFELKPDSDTIWQGAHVKINSHGERDREYAIPKPDGVYRIIGLGDSVTFGPGIEQNETFLDLLEVRLGNGFEVINAGVSAYNTNQEYILLKNRLMEYEPDMVIYNFFNNDGDPTDILKRYKTVDEAQGAGVMPRNKILAANLAWLFPMPQQVNIVLLENSAFFRFLNIRSYNILSRINPYAYPPNTILFVNGMDSWQMNTDALRSMIDLSREEGFELIVVLHPFLQDRDDNIEWAKDISAEEGIPYLNLYDYYKERGVVLEDAGPDGIHPNEETHKIISDGLYDFVLQTINSD
jgi:lysophospholipase L1-like esterase